MRTAYVICLNGDPVSAVDNDKDRAYLALNMTANEDFEDQRHEYDNDRGHYDFCNAWTIIEIPLFGGEDD